MGVLNFCGTYFKCRHCYQLVYGSEQESTYDRVLRKNRKIRKKLGADSDLDITILQKPKGMHWSTFDKLYRQEEKTQQIIQRKWEYLLTMLRKVG